VFVVASSFRTINKYRVHFFAVPHGKLQLEWCVPPFPCM
jgi:hypothetical protein